MKPNVVSLVSLNSVTPSPSAYRPGIPGTDKEIAATFGEIDKRFKDTTMNRKMTDVLED